MSARVSAIWRIVLQTSLLRCQHAIIESEKSASRIRNCALWLILESILRVGSLKNSFATQSGDKRNCCKRSYSGAYDLSRPPGFSLTGWLLSAQPARNALDDFVNLKLCGVDDVNTPMGSPRAGCGAHKPRGKSSPSTLTFIAKVVRGTA